MVWKKVRRGRALGTAAVILAFAILLLVANYGAGSDYSSSTHIDNTPSVTGITYTREMPFSKESLSDIKERGSSLPAAGQERRAIPFHKSPPPKELSSYGTPLQGNKPLGAVQSVPAVSPLAPALSNNFSGLSDNLAFPPDTQGAVGPSHLMEILNTEVGFFTKPNGALISKVSLKAFWSSLGNGSGEPAEFPFDPKIIYDQHSGRFVVVTLGGAYPQNSWLMLAVSETSDPTGNWSKWAVDADMDGAIQTPNWADFPGLGVDAGYVYVTANMFNNSDDYNYSKVWVINKTQLLNGSSNITVTEFSAPIGYGFAMQPAHVLGSSSAEYFVDESYYAYPPLMRLINVNNITFPGGIPTWNHLGYIAVATYPLSELPDAPQNGGPNTIEMNDARLLNVVFRNGYLWTAHTVSNDTNTMTEVAWYQINPASASLIFPGTPVQQGRISDASRWYYFPSIAVNSNGSVGIGFSGSSATEYVGAYYTARITSDTNGTMQPVALLKAGLDSYSKTDSYGRNRWGDYSATVVDPSDDRTFWTLQEYANTPANTWGTWWGKFVPASDLIAPSITSFSPPSPVTDTAGAVRTFNITVNQTVNVTWYINGTEVFNQTDVTMSSYTNTSAAAGAWNVTAVANNTNGTAMKVWDWVVEDSIIDSCTTISSPGNYVLNRSIVNSAASTCINITSNDVVFDGAGYMIDGVGAYGTYGVYAGTSSTPLTNITVRNITATGWHYGIYYRHSHNGTIQNSNVSYNLYGIWLYYSDNNSVSNNTISNSTYNGIRLDYSNNSSKIDNNTVRSNLLTGIWLLSSDNNTLSNNTVISSQGGIYLYSSSDNNLENNNASSNSEYGIELYYDSDNNILTNNSAKNNSQWDFYSKRTSINTAVNLDIGTIISFTGQDILIKPVSSPPANPSNHRNVSKYINVTNSSGNSWLYLNMSYSDSDLTGIIESTLSMWRHNGSAWSQVGGTNGVDVAQNYVYANITSFSIFAPMGMSFDIDSCATISMSGTYRLVQNITSSGSSTCIEITASNVTFDGAGYTIDGMDNAGSYGVHVYNTTAALSNITVKNITVTDWYYGIYYDSVLNGSINNNTVKSNFDGIEFYNSSNSTLISNNASSNSDYGIFLLLSNYTILTSNTAYSNFFSGVYLISSSNNSLISNFANDNKWAGIYLSSYSDNNTITNSMANMNTLYGIYLENSHSNIITDNSASNNMQRGISLGSMSNNNTIINNTADLNAQYGIYLGNSHSNIIANNTADLNAQYGIYLGLSNNNTIANNSASNNTGTGICIELSNNNTIANNSASNNTDTGIHLFSANDNTVTRNIASVNHQFGISIHTSNSIAMTNNIVNNNTFQGIYIFTSDSSNLTGNTVNSNHNNGIVIQSSPGNILLGNVASNNSDHGIYLAYSDDNTLINNILSWNDGDGISIQFSDRNILSNNTANSNSGGIYFSTSSGNTVSNNTANSNTDTGIRLQTVSNATLINNSMTNNTYNFDITGNQESDFNNTINQSNAVDGKSIFYFFKNGSDNVYDSTANAGAFYCILCSNVSVKDLTFTKNGAGVFFWGTNNSKVENVTATLNKVGINIAYSNNTTIASNNVSSNINGIYQTFSGGNTLSNITALSNAQYGIAIYNSNNNTLTNSNVSMNGDGIILEESNNNTFSNNSVTSNFDSGIFLGYSNYNSLSNSTAYNSTLYGIYLMSSSSNTFININSSSNTWDFYSILGSINNSIINFSIPLPISFTGKDIALRSASPPADNMPGYHNLSRYINATNTSLDSWLFLNMSYDESEITNLNESSLRIWRYKNSAWSQVPNSGVDTAANRVYANSTSFSIFAPLALPDTTPPSVTNLSVAPSAPQKGDSVNITVDASDVNMDFTAVFVSVKHPSGYTNISQMNGNGSYYYVYTNTSIEEGRYNVTINASDVLGNFNNTQSTWFIVTSSTFSANTSDNNAERGYGPKIWNRTNFPGFVENEELGVLNVSDRVINQNNLWYNTTRNITPYYVYSYNPAKLVENALDENGTKQPSGGGYYAKIGWLGTSYVALNGNASKLADLLLEYRGIGATANKKTLNLGETWDMGGGYALTVQDINFNVTPNRTRLVLSKNGLALYDKEAVMNDVYNFSMNNSASETDVPIFMAYIDSMFNGMTGDMIQLKYIWLISDSIINITAGGQFGNLVVNLSNETQINLTNANSNISLSQNSTVNLMDRLYFNVLNSTSLEYYPFLAPIHIDALDLTDTTLDVFEKSGMAASINITGMRDTPLGINRSFGMTPFGKFISINATPNVVGNLSWMKIRIFYTGSELSASGLTESSLKITRYNESVVPQQWEILTTSLNTTDTDIYTGYVEANVSHLSYYGIVGNPISTPPPTQPPCTDCNGPGGGGGGGGGGGTSGENFTNIEIKERHDLYISKDTAASYRFNYTDPIIFVNITSNISAGDVTTSVEVLKNTSTLVKSPAPDVVYKNVNIWVGTSGFAVPKNIKQGIIVFRVLNSWLADNGIGSIRMMKWDGSAWIDLKTEERSRDGTHTYYEAETDSFSPFAITGVKGRATVEVTGTPAKPTETVTPAATPMEEPGGLKEILKITTVILIAIIAILAAVYVSEQKKR